MNMHSLFYFVRYINAEKNKTKWGVGGNKKTNKKKDYFDQIKYLRKDVEVGIKSVMSNF